MHPSDDLLNAYADGSIEPADRAGLDAHLASCPICRQTVDDLREIVRASGTLEPRDPPARAWSRIERAIRLEREAQASTERGQNASAAPTHVRPRGLRSASSLAWLAAAAAFLVATFVGLRYSPSSGEVSRTSAAADRGPAAAGDSVEVEAELREAETHYENAIKGLEQIANAEQNALDPNTAATLQKNLAVIDQAISESRAAVRSQPASEPAQQSLIENFKTKIALLQDTVALINEMRKGNEAGAARIVSGLKQKGN
jgi:anti-sigma factor ChrR (cupin superfamily)